MATGRDLVEESLRLIGVLADGEVSSASQLTGGLRSLKRMLGIWSAQSLTIFKYDIETFPLTAGKASYTFGATGDFGSSTPFLIKSAAWTIPQVIVTEITPPVPGDPLADPPVDPIPGVYLTTYKPTLESPINILNIQEWAGVRMKANQSTIVTDIYVEDSAPRKTIHVYPVPAQDGGIVFYSLKKLSSIEADDVVEFPEGYEDAIVFNLALRLSPEYGREPSGVVVSTARETLGVIRAANSKPVYLKVDPAITGGRRPLNIYSGGT